MFITKLGTWVKLKGILISIAFKNAIPLKKTPNISTFFINQTYQQVISIVSFTKMLVDEVNF